MADLLIHLAYCAAGGLLMGVRRWKVVPVKDLIDFLLARIAEDSTRISRLAAQPWWPTDGDTLPLLSQGLDDCRAKRRIVEDAGPWINVDCRYGRCQHRVDDADGGESHWRGVQGWFTLTMLALPYASHPDYQQEWRP